jgi:hypothetical protein
MKRLLRHTQNDINTLALNPRHKFAAKHALVHYPSGAIYSFIPKNGCTTLRYSLAIGNQCIEGPDDFVWIHENNTTFSADLRDLITASYSFVILRCPYARLASAFLDKVVSKTYDIWMLRRLVNDSIDLDEITFRSFCSLLEPRHHRTSNMHWRNQSDFLVYREYDGWFRLEAFDQAAVEIEKRTGLVVHDSRNLANHSSERFTVKTGEDFADCPVHELSKMQRAGYSPSYASLYDAALINKVSHWYADDIALYTDHFGSDGLLFS